MGKHNVCKLNTGQRGGGRGEDATSLNMKDAFTFISKKRVFFFWLRYGNIVVLQEKTETTGCITIQLSIRLSDQHNYLKRILKSETQMLYLKAGVTGKRGKI